MTEAQVRQKIVSVMQGWIGCRESDGSHKKIIDAYNSHRPLPRGYAVKYTDAWCATATSAAAVVAGYTDIVPLECSCYYIVENAKKMGIWQEVDSYTPKPGDLVLYDWQDSGVGNNTGGSDHIGMVESVTGGNFVVIEGNKNDAVGRRTMAINGRYIRGFICPKYASKATSSESGSGTSTGTGSNTGGSTAAKSYKVGDVVDFTGNKHYISANSTSAKTCKPGKAKITQVYQLGKSKHPYHLIAEKGGGSSVYGWVDESAVKGSGGSSANTTTNATYVAGDKVRVTGTIYGNGNGTGGSLKKKGEVMYVTGLVDSKKYNYYIGVAAKKGGARQGWAKPSQLTKC